MKRNLNLVVALIASLGLAGIAIGQGRQDRSMNAKGRPERELLPLGGKARSGKGAPVGRAWSHACGVIAQKGLFPFRFPFLFLLLLLLFLAAASSGALEAADERVITLQDGSRVVLRADGSMGHYSRSGAPMPMRDGEVMIAGDGTRLLMKGDALWRQIVDYATANFALASAFPSLRSEGGERWVDLADGGRVRLLRDGTMIHLDAAGNAVAMPDGDVMIAKDGTAIMMKGASLWGAMGPRGPAGSKP